MELLTISDLKTRAREASHEATFHAQVEEVIERETKGGKPFYELKLRDASDGLVLKVWENHPRFGQIVGVRSGNFLAVSGVWELGDYGLEGRGWNFDPLGEEEIDALFSAGGAGHASGQREGEERDFAYIAEQVAGLADPRLKGLCDRFFVDFGDRFRRTAAARKNHHARRGGLVEHVAQMMRTALAVAGAYPDLNKDLLVAGVLFHDCGKLWENSYPARGFQMPYDLRGELLGHIPIGMELVNKLWRDLMEEEVAKEWATLTPASDLVRLHLLHLIASHHGEYQFGAPTLPRTPEALVLHHVDNIDAKMEMMRRGYAESPQLGEGIFEKAWPLPSNLVAPLSPFQGESIMS